MKIALVTNTSWNIYNFRKGLTNFFIERGDQVIVLAPIDKYTEEISKWELSFFETKIDQTGTNPVKDIKYLFRLISIFKKERPDIILSFTIKSNIYSSLAGKYLGIPAICNVSGLGTVFLVKGWLGRLAINLYRFSFRYACYVFFQNDDDKALFTSYVKLKENRVGLLPGSGIDLQHFTRQNLKMQSPTKYLMIARIIEEKGVREYIEAARVLKKSGIANFSLVGSLDTRHSRSIRGDELKEWVDQKLIAYIPHSDNIMDLIASHEVIILPSYREGTPRTLLEGGAVGRTLMASDVPGCKEVVRNGFNGFLFDVKSAESIVEKVKLYAKLSQEEKVEMAQNARKYVEEKFDEKIVIGQYSKTINELVH